MFVAIPSYSMTNSEIEISQHSVVDISKTDSISEDQILAPDPEMEKSQQAQTVVSRHSWDKLNAYAQELIINHKIYMSDKY